MNAELEQIIEKLIRAHGTATVRRSLEKLVNPQNWTQWQEVDSTITNVSNRLAREAARKVASS